MCDTSMRDLRVTMNETTRNIVKMPMANDRDFFLMSDTIYRMIVIRVDVSDGW